MQFRTTVIAVLAGVICWSFSHAQNSSADGLALLKIEHSARAAGMGGAFGAISGDPNSAAYNPAGVSNIKTFTASFGHTVYWQNIRLESGYFAKPISHGLSLHGGIRFAAVDKLELRTTPTTEPEEMFDAHDISIKGGLAWNVTGRVSVGFGLGWFIEKIEAWRGSAFNVDVGLQAKLDENLSVGVSAVNLGSDFTLEKSGLSGSREISLPTTYRVGGSYRFQKYHGVADIVVIDDDIHLHLGAEADIHERFTVRAGYMSGYDTRNVTAGATFLIRNITVDYGFVPFTSSLGTSHLFNMTFSL